MTKPHKNDLILGGHNPPTMAVLGGIQGVEKRLAAGDTSALHDGLKYGTQGEELIRQFFSAPDHAQFFIDLSRAGYIPRLSQKRFYWSGPCVDCPKKDLLKVIRSTTVDLVWDDQGPKHWTIYPAEYSFEALEEGLLDILAGGETKIHLEAAIALCISQGDPLKTLAQNFVDRVSHLREIS